MSDDYEVYGTTNIPPNGSMWSIRTDNCLSPTLRNEYGEIIEWRARRGKLISTLCVLETKPAGRKGNKHGLAISRVIADSANDVWIETSWLYEIVDGCWVSPYYTRIA